MRVVLFFLHHGFVPLGFPDKVLMRQHEAYYKSCMVMASKGECYKSWSGLPLTKTRREGPSATTRPSRGRVQGRERESATLGRLSIRSASLGRLSIKSSNLG